MDNKEKLINSFKSMFKNKYNIIILAAFIGVLLIVFSDSKKENNDKITSEDTSLSDTELFVNSLEEKLNRIICSITGEDEVEIMITTVNSYEKVYAKETEENGDKKGEEYVIIKNSSQSQSAVMLKEIEPEIKGAVVVTDKADNGIIKEQIINAVKTVLGISSNKVSVVSRYKYK